MYCTRKVTEDLIWVGADDRRLACFEGVYGVPDGVSYNSYLLLDEKTVLFDTVDKAVYSVFLENVAHALNGRPLDYLVVQHMEPDHAATQELLLSRYPEAKIICNAKIQTMMKQFMGCDLSARTILVKEGDALIVDRIGKNYSGTGVDPNITGTFSTPYASGGVQVQRTCFLRLSDESHGNSLGVGLASAITRHIFDIIDADAMYTNCMTSTVIKSAMVPCVLSTDKEAIQFCIRTCNRIDRENPKVIRIKNSLHIGQVMLSGAYYEDVLAGKYQGLKALDAPQDMMFDQEDTLTTPWLP